MDWSKKGLRRLNIATHRDLGYFFSVLVIVYCLSGIALNHVDDWNPDFILTKQELTIPVNYQVTQIRDKELEAFSKMVGESRHKLVDSPTKDQLKIYYKDASLHLNFSTRKGLYEHISKRPIFYEVNAIHRNSLKGWKWASDVFAVLLIVITLTGLFILKGKHGLWGRGKWLIAAGVAPVVIFVVLLALK